MFQARHFEYLARALRRKIDDDFSRRDAANALANAFEEDEPRFNRHRFLIACKIASEASDD